jgi:CheY-like chemotaxis protein
MELENAPFDLHDAVIDAVRVLGANATGKSLELVCRLAPALPRQVVGDAGRLRQILVNLVGNAIKFTQSGEIYVNVDIERQSSRELLAHFCVRDTGIGIPPDKQHHIFESFSQADASTTRRFGGTGLGLTISKQLVEMMGGRIWVTSEVEVGSTFHFTARLSTLSIVEQHDEYDLPPDAQWDGAPRVLVLDYHPHSRDMYVELLTALRIQVTTAADVAQAATLLQQTDPPFHAALVIGRAHPDRSATRLVQRLAETLQTLPPPILLISPPGLTDLETSTDRFPRLRHVAGPLPPSQLKEQLRELLRGTQDIPRPAATTPPTQPVRPLHILLAEDCLVNREVAIGLLELRGHHVQVAETGRQAVSMVQQQAFDLILMDVEMPEMDGLEATRIIRQQQPASAHSLPIVAMTAHAIGSVETACKEAGMDAYITKPVQPNSLYEIVESLVEHQLASPRKGV